MFRFLTAQTACLLIVFSCFARQKDSTAGKSGLPNEWMIKFAPLSILDSDGGLNFSVEFVAKQRFGFQLEVQPVLFSIQNDGGTNDPDEPMDVLQSGPLRGIKIRPEIRYYFDGLKLNRPGSSQYGPGTEARRGLGLQTYLAVAFMFKQTRQQRVNELYISSNGTQQGYRQQAEYTDVKRVTQLEGKFGVLRPLSKEHWLADVYFGLGLRIRKIGYQNLPPGASEPIRAGFFGGDPGTSSETFPAFPFGIRIVYRL